MSLTNLECQVSELVDSDACPRPTTGDRRAVHPALPAHYGRRGRRGGIPVHPPRRQQEAVGAGDAVPLGPGAQHRPARGRGHQGPWQVLSLSCLPLSLSPSISVFISVCRSVCLHVCLPLSLSDPHLTGSRCSRGCRSCSPRRSSPWPRCSTPSPWCAAGGHTVVTHHPARSRVLSAYDLIEGNGSHR